MGLNINAKRRLSLKGFAEGWDDCYLLVRAVSSTRAEAMQDELNKLKDEDNSKAADALMREYCAENILGGVIMNTIDGNEVEYEFTKDEAPEVVDNLNAAWQLEVIDISTGVDRLKFMRN